MSFPGILLPSEAGTIGEIQGLNTGQPRMVLQQPDGVLTLQGVLVRPASGVLCLSCDGSKHAVSCQDIFTAMIAFVKASWKPTVASGPTGDSAAQAGPSGVARRRQPFVPAGCVSHGHIGCGRPAEAEEAARAGYDEGMTAKWFSARGLADQMPSSAEGAGAEEFAPQSSLSSSQGVRPGRSVPAKLSQAARASGDLVELYGPLAAQTPAASPVRATPQSHGKRARVSLGRWSLGKALSKQPQATADSDDGDDYGDTDEDDDGEDHHGDDPRRGSGGNAVAIVSQRSGRRRTARGSVQAENDDEDDEDLGTDGSSAGADSPQARGKRRRPVNRVDEAAVGNESSTSGEGQASDVEEAETGAESDFDPDD